MIPLGVFKIISLHLVSKKIGLKYFPRLQMIEYCRLNIEYLRNAIILKKDNKNDRAKRHPQIFNFQFWLFRARVPTLPPLPY